MRATLTAILFAALSLPALGDGIHLSRAADPSPMPAQCAVLSWTDGVETLAVRTEVTTVAGPSAWIVPTPSTPEVFAVEPGVVESARAAFAPEIVEPRVDIALLAAFGAVAVILAHIAVAARGPIVTRVVLLLVAVFAWALVVLIGVPAFGNVRGVKTARAAGPTVTVHDLRTIGRQEVAVISSTDPRALADWLRAFGLAVPAKAEGPIAAYCAEGWSFVASRLLDAEAGASTPEPVGMRFKTPHPVYPMRLTGAGNGKEALDLELLIYGLGVASVPGMTVQSAGRVEYIDENTLGRTPLVPGETIRLGHEGVRALTGAAPWATWLRGRFTPDAMAADLSPTFGEGVEVRRQAQSRGDQLLAYATAAGIGAAAVGVILLPIAARPWTRRRAGLTGLVIAVVAVAGGWRMNRGIHTAPVVREDGLGPTLASWERFREAWFVVWGASPPPATVPQARAMFETAWAKESPGTPAPAFGWGPGQYLIREATLESRRYVEFSWVNWYGQREVLDGLPLPDPTPTPTP